MKLNVKELIGRVFFALLIVVAVAAMDYAAYLSFTGTWLSTKHVIVMVSLFGTITVGMLWIALDLLRYGIDSTPLYTEDRPWIE